MRHVFTHATIGHTLTAMLLALVPAAPLAAAGDPLDGRQFNGAIGEEGSQAGDSDLFVFDGGSFRSQACDAYGFGTAPYTATREGETVTFRATTRSPGEGVMEWQGSARNGQLEGTVSWKKEGRTTRMWFRGVETTGKGATAQAASPETIYREMEQMFGGVPSFFRLVPDNSLELEWRLFKTVQFDPGPVPNKYRELIGVALAAVTHCRYCIVYHTELARLHGATDAEIEDAVHFAKSSAGWSTYLNGMQIDFDEFAAEVRGAVAHARRQAAR